MKILLLDTPLNADKYSEILTSRISADQHTTEWAEWAFLAFYEKSFDVESRLHWSCRTMP